MEKKTSSIFRLQLEPRVGKGERLHGVRKAVTGQVKEIVIFLLFSFLPSLQQESHHSHCPPRAVSIPKTWENVSALSLQLALVVRPSFPPGTGGPASIAGCFFPRLLVGCLRQPRLTKNSSTSLCGFASRRVSCTPSPFHHFWAPTWTVNDSCLVT
jgi:hypothetical protein